MYTLFSWTPQTQDLASSSVGKTESIEVESIVTCPRTYRFHRTAGIIAVVIAHKVGSKVQHKIYAGGGAP